MQSITLTVDEIRNIANALYLELPKAESEQKKKEIQQLYDKFSKIEDQVS